MPRYNHKFWHLNHTNTIERCSDRDRKAIVGIIDTGIDVSNREFSARVKSGLRFASMSKLTLNTAAAPQDFSPDYHGTAVASLVAGETVGVVPGCDLAVCALQPDYGSFIENGAEAIAIAIEWMADLDPAPDVVVCSLGVAPEDGQPAIHYPNLLQAVEYLVEQRAIPLVAANGDRTRGCNAPQFPAAYDIVMSVGASRRDNTSWNDNVQHGGKPNISAPGEFVPAACDPTSFSGLDYWSGTSFAAPIAAGTLTRILNSPRALLHACGDRRTPGRFLRAGTSSTARGAGVIFLA